MNVWNAHTATSANKLFTLAALLAITLTLPPPAQAQDASTMAPSFFGVSEFIVQHPRFGNTKASAACGTSTGEFTKLLLAALKTSKLPAISVVGAPVSRPHVERVNICPDVVTVQPRDDECVSWISLSVEKKAELRLDPIDTPRKMTVTYWSGGVMTGTTAASHAISLKDAAEKLSQQLARQYFADQPSTIKDPAAPVAK